MLENNTRILNETETANLNTDKRKYGFARCIVSMWSPLTLHVLVVWNRVGFKRGFIGLIGTPTVTFDMIY